MKKLLLFVSLILLTFSACKDKCEYTNCLNESVCVDGTCDCEDGYEGNSCENTVATKFIGTYDIVCNGTLDIDGTNQSFSNEPGTAKIYQGEKPDEIILYVQLDLITDAFPMTVEAFGEVDDLEYETDAAPQKISGDIAGLFTIDYTFTVKAEGELNDDFDELESTVTFSGDLTGVITCEGEKQ